MRGRGSHVPAISPKSDRLLGPSNRYFVPLACFLYEPLCSATTAGPVRRLVRTRTRTQHPLGSLRLGIALSVKNVRSLAGSTILKLPVIAILLEQLLPIRLCCFE